MEPVERAWELQQQWSAAATEAHRKIKQLRAANLLLLVAAAAAGAIGGVFYDSDWLVRLSGIASAGLLACAGFLQQRFLRSADVGRWVEIRLAAERMKSSVWRSLGLGLDDAASQQLLLDELDAVEARLGTLGVPINVPPIGLNPLPTVPSISAYVERRAEGQAKWHHDAVDGLVRRSRRVRGAELVVTATGIVVSVLAAAFTGWTLAPIVAGLSAVATALIAHLSAAKYERIASGYDSTARRLRTLIATFPTEPSEGERALFVDDVERVLAEQNAAWVSLLGAD